MKVAIVTFSGAQNFGAQLQSHALLSYVESLGHVGCHLAFRDFDARALKPRREWKDILATLYHLPQNFQRICHYRSFIKQFLKISSPIRSREAMEQCNEEYDVFISGSDQVWNCLAGINRAFYLDFVRDDKKKISYAASFGRNQVPEQYRADVARLINRMSACSVREAGGADLVESITGKRPTVCIDPVFLFSSDYWKQIAIVPRLRKPYIFVYSTQLSDHLNRAVKKYFEKNRVRIITTHSILGVPCDTHKEIGPREFLGWILNAECVISTSFHATAFSIIFGKKFIAVSHSETSARVRELLDAAGLSSCLYEGDDCDFSDIVESYDGMSRLKKHIADSKQFLNDQLPSSHD